MYGEICFSPGSPPSLSLCPVFSHSHVCASQFFPSFHCPLVILGGKDVGFSEAVNACLIQLLFKPAQAEFVQFSKFPRVDSSLYCSSAALSCMSSSARLQPFVVLQERMKDEVSQKCLSESSITISCKSVQHYSNF